MQGYLLSRPLSARKTWPHRSQSRRRRHGLTVSRHAYLVLGAGRQGCGGVRSLRGTAAARVTLVDNNRAAFAKEPLLKRVWDAFWPTTRHDSSPRRGRDASGWLWRRRLGPRS